MIDKPKIYLVGGAVRDQLLGLTPKERDWVVVGSTPEALITQGYQPVGKDFPVFLHPETKEEYALARTERKIGMGYHGFSCGFSPDITLEEDLLRRDLTINAIAQDPEGHHIDPYGGLNDLKHRILRHVSPAFIEDPLRLLRVARFAARLAPLGFTVAPETQELLRHMVRAGELEHLTPERVWREWLLILGASQPDKGIAVLRQTGALERLFPEWNALFGMPHTLTSGCVADAGKAWLDFLSHAGDLNDIQRCAGVFLFSRNVGRPYTQWFQPPASINDDWLKALMQRYRVAKDISELSRLCLMHPLPEQPLSSTHAEEWLDWLERIDAFRRTPRALQYLEIYRIQTLSSAHSPILHPKIASLGALITALKQISLAPELLNSLSGTDIQKALRAQRLECIKKT